MQGVRDYPNRTDRVRQSRRPGWRGVRRQPCAGNTTRFTTFEYGVSGRRLELLNKIAPCAGIGQFATMQRSPGLGSGAFHGGRPIDEQ